MSCTPQSRCLDDSKSEPGPDGDSSIFHFALLSAAQSIFNFPLHLLCEVHMKSTVCCHCLAPSEVDFPACKSQGCLTGRKQSLQRNSTGCCDPWGNANLHGPLLGNKLYFRAQIYVVLGRGKQIGCVAVNSASSFGDSRAAMICRGYKSGPIVSNSFNYRSYPLWIFQKKHLWSAMRFVIEVGRGGHLFALFFRSAWQPQRRHFFDYCSIWYLSHRDKALQQKRG